MGFGLTPLIVNSIFFLKILQVCMKTQKKLKAEEKAIRFEGG